MLLRSIEEFGRSEVVRLWGRVPLVIMCGHRPLYNVEAMRRRLDG